MMMINKNGSNSDFRTIPFIIVAITRLHQKWRNITIIGVGVCITFYRTNWNFLTCSKTQSIESGTMLLCTQ
jgi:hypothetical protein